MPKRNDSSRSVLRRAPGPRQCSLLSDKVDHEKIPSLKMLPADKVEPQKRFKSKKGVSAKQMRGRETEVKPIRLIFDEEPEKSFLPQIKPVSPLKSKVSRFELATGYSYFRAENFKANPKLAEDKLKSRPLEIDHLNTDPTSKPESVIEMMRNFSMSDSPSSLKRNLKSLVDNSVDGLTAQYESVIATFKSSETKKVDHVNEKEVISAAMLSSPKNGSILRRDVSSPRKLTPKIKAQQNEDFGETFQTYSDLMRISIKMDLLGIEKSITTRIQKSKVCRKSTVQKLAVKLKLDALQLEGFNIYTDSELLNSFENVSDGTLPDTFKHHALSGWQSRDLKKCIYYLSKSHGVFLKSDILDKHLEFLSLPEEHHSCPKGVDPDLHKVQIDKFNQQSKDLSTFGITSTSFFEDLKKFDPDWNIVQLTTIFSACNRFSTAKLAETECPALFLTCISSLPGSTNKQSFVTFIPEPKSEEGISQLDIIGDFKKVIHDNDRLHEGRVNRRDYLAARDKYDFQLKRCIAGMEENWLSPWYFLLCGNIIDTDIRKKIYKFVRAVELALNKKLSASQLLAFFKLVENHNILSPELQRFVPELLSYILDEPIRNLTKIAHKLRSLTTWDSSAKRHPTILVIDQSIELLPWDWLPCLRGTTVTRVPSLAVLHSLMNLAKNISPADPCECTYVLNPDDNLKNVQARLMEYLRSRKSWKGVVGKKPSLVDIEDTLRLKDMYLYCGHGSGSHVYPEICLRKIFCRAIPVLMGCASASSKYFGPRTLSSSIVNSYFTAGCPSVVGFLWNVSDADCDRITVELIQRWSPGEYPLPAISEFDSSSERPEASCLAIAVHLSRSAAIFFLSAAGIVNYGVPIKKPSQS